MARRNDVKEPQVSPGTGNVFADLGFPDAADRQTKVRLGFAINGVIRLRKLNQTAAASLLGVTQSKISALSNYRLAGFSVEKLMHFLTALDQDVEIVIRAKPKSRRPAQIVVTAA